MSYQSRHTDHPVESEAPTPGSAEQPDVASGTSTRLNRTAKRRVQAVVVGGLSLCAVVGLYWLVAMRGGVNSTLMPTPDRVARTFAEEVYSGELLSNLGLSLRRVLLGYAIGMSLAVILGTLAGWFRPVGLVINPLIDAIRPIPALAYLPLIILWVGIGESARVVIIILAAFKAGVVSSRAGMAEVPSIYIDAAKTLGATRKRIFWTIALPATIPYVAAGMRVGFTTSWLAVVAAELVAANGGLGYMIRNAGRYFQTDVVMVGIITIGVVAFVLDRLLQVASLRLTRWSERAEV